jgi:CubicO group peptidase (beta-lactamase class C family)
VLVGSSFMYASARDWARLGQLMLNEGMLNGHRILSADWVHRSRRPNPSRNEPRYGYQFWLNGGGNNRRWPDLPDDAFAMMGNRSQVVMMIPSRQTVIVRLGWSADGYPTSQRFASLLAALDRADGKGNAFR